LKNKKVGQILVLAKDPKKHFFFQGPGPEIFFLILSPSCSKQIFFFL